MSEKAIRLSLEVSPQLNAKLEELAAKTHGSKSEVLRRAIALMDIAVQAKEDGKKFGVAGKDQELATEIVGI